MIGETRILGLNEAKGYDEFVAALPEAMLYHERPWLELIRRVAGGDCHIIALTRGGKLLAALPVFLSPDNGLGRVLNSLPFFGSVGGVLCREHDFPQTAPPLLAALDTFAHQTEAVSVMLNPGPLAPRAEAYRRLWRPDAEDARIGQMTPLPQNSGEIPALLHHSKRRNIKSAQGKGVSVRTGGQQDVDWVETTHRHAMAAKNGLAKPSAFFDCLRADLATDGPLRLAMAEGSQGPCAALVHTLHGRTAEYLVPVHDMGQASQFGLALLILHCMEEAVAAGATRWNFGGTWTTQEGVYRFKSYFGAQDLPYTYFIKIYDPGLLNRSREELAQAFPWYYALPFALLRA